MPSHSTTVEIIFIGDSTDLKMIELCSINSGNATRGSILGTEVTYCFIPGLRIFHIRFYGVHLNGPYFRDASSTDVLSWLYTSISKLKDHIKHTPDIVIISSNYWDTAGLYWREGLPNRTRRDAHIWPPAPWYQRPSLLPLQFLLDWKSNPSHVLFVILCAITVMYVSNMLYDGIFFYADFLLFFRQDFSHIIRHHFMTKTTLRAEHISARLHLQLRYTNSRMRFR